MVGEIMKKRLLRKLNTDTNAGITTYVLIMFGMIFILYLFDFSSMWGTYIQTQVGGQDVTNSSFQSQPDFMGIIIKTIQDNIVFAAGGLAAAVFAIVIGKLTDTTATVLQFLLPVLLLVALNIFVFPFNSMHDVDMGFMSALSISTFLFAFFNICYILAVVEFIRGGGT
jgi:hypothetical protein